MPIPFFATLLKSAFRYWGVDYIFRLLGLRVLRAKVCSVGFVGARGVNN